MTYKIKALKQIDATPLAISVEHWLNLYTLSSTSKTYRQSDISLVL